MCKTVKNLEIKEILIVGIEGTMADTRELFAFKFFGQQRLTFLLGRSYQFTFIHKNGTTGLAHPSLSLAVHSLNDRQPSTPPKLLATIAWQAAKTGSVAQS